MALAQDLGDLFGLSLVPACLDSLGSPSFCFLSMLWTVIKWRITISLSQESFKIISAKTLSLNQVLLEGSRDTDVMSKEAIVSACSRILRTCLDARMQE